MFKKIKKWYSDYRLNKAIKIYIKCVLDDDIISEWSEEMDRLLRELGKIENDNVKFTPIMDDFFLDITNDDKKLSPDIQSIINEEIRKWSKK